jgi:hypothetical protein
MYSILRTVKFAAACRDQLVTQVYQFIFPRQFISCNPCANRSIPTGTNESDGEARISPRNSGRLMEGCRRLA